MCQDACTYNVHVINWKTKIYNYLYITSKDIKYMSNIYLKYVAKKHYEIILNVLYEVWLQIITFMFHSVIVK